VCVCVNKKRANRRKRLKTRISGKGEIKRQNITQENYAFIAITQELHYYLRLCLNKVLISALVSKVVVKFRY